MRSRSERLRALSGVACLGEKAPCRTATIRDHCLTEVRRWEEPDGPAASREKRLH